MPQGWTVNMHVKCGIIENPVISGIHSFSWSAYIYNSLQKLIAHFISLHRTKMDFMLDILSRCIYFLYKCHHCTLNSNQATALKLISTEILMMYKVRSLCIYITCFSASCLWNDEFVIPFRGCQSNLIKTMEQNLARIGMHQDIYQLVHCQSKPELWNWKFDVISPSSTLAPTTLHRRSTLAPTTITRSQTPWQSLWWSCKTSSETSYIYTIEGDRSLLYQESGNCKLFRVCNWWCSFFHM